MDMLSGKHKLRYSDIIYSLNVKKFSRRMNIDNHLIIEVVDLFIFFLGCCRLRLGWKSLQNSMYFFSNGRKNELELLFCSYHFRTLISEMFQCRSNVDFLCSFGHTAQYHVDETVSAATASPITTVNHYWAGSAAVRLIDFSPTNIQI